MNVHLEPLHFLIFVHFWSRHCKKSLLALRRTPSSGEFLDVCHGWHRPDRISWSWLQCCRLDNLVQSQAMRKPCVLCFDLCCCTWRCPRNFLHLDLRTFLKRTSAWKCIVMLDLPLCKLLRGEALLVVWLFFDVSFWNVFLDIRHLLPWVHVRQNSLPFKQLSRKPDVTTGSMRWCSQLLSVVNFRFNFTPKQFGFSTFLLAECHWIAHSTQLERSGVGIKSCFVEALPFHRHPPLPTLWMGVVRVQYCA